MLYAPSATGKSSSLSTGAKAGIGAGVAVAAIIFLVLLGFIFYQRKQTSKLRNSQGPPAGLSGAALDSAGKSELEGLGLAGAEKAGLASKNDSSILTTPGRVEGYEAGAAVLETGSRLSNAADINAGLPLTTEERRELDSRRRAAELSGQGFDIPTEEGIGERAELEERRKHIHELGA
jgi:hypothetical protein